MALEGVWDGIHPCDMPPLNVQAIYMSERQISSMRGPDRKQVVQKFPGKPIIELKNAHKGKCVLFFNGETLGHHDLWRVRESGATIIGMNRTHLGHEGYKGPQPDYLCAIDPCWFREGSSLLTHPKIINGGTNKVDTGYRVTRNFRMTPFSLDLWWDGFVPATPCTTGHLAMQFAVYAGFTELFCLGLDFGGGHFDGTKASNHMKIANLHLSRMSGVMRKAGVKTFVCGSPNSNCTAFPKVSFEAIFDN
jgi:hypothetical protein